MADADFTVKDVLEWARTKPAYEQYDFIHSDVCALGQFAREMRGFSKSDAACQFYRKLVPENLFNAVNGKRGRAGWTFGKLVGRLEALVPVTQSSWTHLDAYLVDIELASA